jgi:hypothetical protein
MERSMQIGGSAVALNLGMVELTRKKKEGVFIPPSKN